MLQTRSPREADDWRTEVLEVHQHSPEQVATTYSRLAPLYELWAMVVESRPRRRLLELAAVRDGEDVLEVAVGTGKMLIALAQANPAGRTAGVDLAGGMLAQARRRLHRAGLDRVNLSSASALDLHFPDQSFDLVVNSYMLDLLPLDDIPRAIAEFWRVLRPGGRLVLANMTRGERRRHRLWDWLYGRGLNVTANCRGVLAVPVLDAAGFSDIRREYMAQMTFPTELVSARKNPMAYPPAP